MTNKVMLRSLFVNIFLIITKLTGGFIFLSSSLITDGFHSLSDMITDFVALFGIKKSNQPADDDHPFGHGKFEYITSFVLGCLIILAGVELILSALDREINSQPSLIIVVIAIGMILSKLFLSRYLIKKGKELDNEIIISSGNESFMDVISSFVVLIGVVTTNIGNRFNVGFLVYGDMVAAILISVLIIWVGISVIIKSGNNLMGITADNETIDNIRRIILSHDEVKDITQMHVIKYGPYYQALISICVDGKVSVKDGHEIANHITEELNETTKLKYVLVHVDPWGENDERN